MKQTITGEQVFQITQSHSMTIGYSESGYTLMYGAGDGNFTAWEESTPSNEVCMVVNFAKGTYFYLAGNTGNVVITY